MDVFVWQLRQTCRVLRLLRRILRSFSTFRLAAAIRKASFSKTAECLQVHDDLAEQIRVSWTQQVEAISDPAKLRAGDNHD